MLKIETRAVSDWQQNARLLFDTETNEVVFVDPGGEIEVLLELADLDHYAPRAIFITHCHIDHVGGVSKLIEVLLKRGFARPTLYYHSDGQFLGDRVAMQAELLGFPPSEFQNAPPLDVDLKNMSTFMIGSIPATLLHTPGHAPGHVALYIPSDSILISGDALFKGSIGRTDLPGGNHETLITSIRTQFLPLPDDTRVLTGHGPDTTIGRERVSNPFLR
jgi:glyoxylase-like metal-dependent hydrolase (beta-lactamase superfamily II)